MSQQPERPFVALNPLNDSAPGGGTMALAAPVGAVSRRDRTRAARTALIREDETRLVLVTDLPGTVSLQRREALDGWVTVARMPASRGGRTTVPLSADEGTTWAYRVVFAPRNANITSWVSEEIRA